MQSNAHLAVSSNTNSSSSSVHSLIHAHGQHLSNMVGMHLVGQQHQSSTNNSIVPTTSNSLALHHGHAMNLHAGVLPGPSSGNGLSGEMGLKLQNADKTPALQLMAAASSAYLGAPLAPPPSLAVAPGASHHHGVHHGHHHQHAMTSSAAAATGVASGNAAAASMLVGGHHHHPNHPLLYHPAAQHPAPGDWYHTAAPASGSDAMNPLNHFGHHHHHHLMHPGAATAY